MQDIVAQTVAAIFGLAAGSFLNVLIYRLPRGESVVFPGSRCPSCGHRLTPWENVPLVSWVVLSGRCRSCHTPISSRYPLVELLCGALCWLSVAQFGITLTAAATALLSMYLIVTVFVDIDHLLILDALTIPVAVAGLICAVVQSRGMVAIEAAALGAALFGAIYILTKGAGLGLGDVKLAACLGLFLGLAGSIAAFAAAFVIGATLAIPVLLTRRRRRRDVLPFGPFLVLGALVVTFAPGLVFGIYTAYQQYLYRHLGGV